MTSTYAVQVRNAAADDESDLRACVDAAYGLYVERIGKPPAPMLEDYAALINNEVVYVATRDGRLVGLIVMWPKEDHLYIDNIAVLPEEQGTGVGSALLAHADREAQRVGFSEIRLYTHAKMTENIQYYPRKGFRETHRATDAGYRRVYFTRHLDPQQT
ncbi:MAG: GNAT family N-acetyltransferase [Acidimicrobiaceae bacterium]|nr:GNAT family N-acetyltransferase [Acidimicrobiaceae bacterium]